MITAAGYTLWFLWDMFLVALDVEEGIEEVVSARRTRTATPTPIIMRRRRS